MGQRRCDGVQIPVRPSGELCIANEDGSAECFDERVIPSQYKKPSVVNHVCFKASEYMNQEEWVKSLIEACKR